jgi:hypothetical protein
MDLTGGGRGTFQSTNRSFDRLFCALADIRERVTSQYKSRYSALPEPAQCTHSSVFSTLFFLILYFVPDVTFTMN